MLGSYSAVFCSTHCIASLQMLQARKIAPHTFLCCETWGFCKQSVNATTLNLRFPKSGLSNRIKTNESTLLIGKRHKAMQLKLVFEWYPSFMVPIFIIPRPVDLGLCVFPHFCFQQSTLHSKQKQLTSQGETDQAGDKINGLSTRSWLARQINICYSKSTSNHLDIRDHKSCLFHTYYLMI